MAKKGTKTTHKSSLNLTKLSATTDKGNIIIGNFEQRVGVNNRSAALGQLNDLSKVLNDLDAALQGDQPDYMR
jgi:hypothetical protein